MSFPITSFHGAYFFLSNFYPVHVTYEGKMYPTVEHAYQAAKSEDPARREAIRKARTPARAKYLGQRVDVRADWHDVRLPIMQELIRQKFKLDPLRGYLLGTGSRKLIETNTWGDTFWGVCKGEGENHLGRILMEARTQLNEWE